MPIRPIVSQPGAVPVTLQIQLFGDFNLTLKGETLHTVDTLRMQSLLAFLALHSEAPQVRSKIAFRFWPDSSEKQALTNLRHLLHGLRGALPGAERFLNVTAKHLQWKADAPSTLDVAAFREALVEAEAADRSGDQGTAVEARERAVALYTGDLLPGSDADWLVEERAALREDFTHAVEHLIKAHEDRRQYTEAIRCVRRLLRHEPTKEFAHAMQIRLHMAKGDRAAGLQAYRECVTVLERELAVGPGPTLRHLHECLLSGEGIPDTTKTRPRAGGSELSMHGRDREWSELKTSWEKASHGAAHLAVMVGEAGIGKTRLAEELLEWVEHAGASASRTRSYAAEGRLAYAPAVQWLRSPPLYGHLKKLQPVWLTEVSRLLPELRHEFSGLPELSGPRESWHQHHLLEALSRAVLAPAEPLLLILDDLQWTDQETLEWLRFLLRFDPRAKLLIVATIRIEEMTPDHPAQQLLLDLQRDDQVTRIELGPLSKEEVSSIAAELAERELTPSEAARLHRETEGNPLFVVESVRAGLRERGPALLPQTTVSMTSQPGLTPLPPKVHAVITMRLAQLSREAREIVGMAAVIGRAFPTEVLLRVCERSESELFPVLDELWQKRIMQEQGAGFHDFTHDKIREVAYAEMIAPQRRRLHRRTAETLESLNLDDLEPVNAQLGAHYEAAGQLAPGIEAYQRAAQAARTIHANGEAIRLLRKALTLLAQLAPTRERSEREIALNSQLGACLVETAGYPAPAVWGVYERTDELCRELSRPTDPPILRALAISSLTIGDLKRARRLGEQFLKLFEETEDPIIQVEGEYVLGVTHHWLGHFDQACGHLESALAAYNPAHRSQHIANFAQDPKAVCLVRLAWSLWFRGLPERALEHLHEGVVYARSLQHPHTEGYTLVFGAQVLIDMGQYSQALELLSRLTELTRDHPMGFWNYRGDILRHFLSIGDRPASECIRDMRGAIDSYGKDRCYVCFSHFLCYIASGHLSAGHIGAGLATIEEAFRALKTIDERHCLAELHRLRAVLLAADGGDPATVEAEFAEALTVARRQGALALELRAALSLGQYRLEQASAGLEEAKENLRKVYDRFSEGFDFSDLKATRAWLEA